MREFLQDRIQVNALLIVLCFVSVLSLSSQSAASYSTYILAITILISVRQWNDLFATPMVWLVLGLLLYLCGSAFWSDPFSWRGVLSIFIRGALVFCFVVALAECQQRGQVQLWLGRALAVVGSVVVIVAMGIFVTADDIRLNGLGQLHAHVVAALVYGVVLIFVLEILLKDHSPAWRLFALASAILIFSAVFLSDSRNAWVSVITGSLVFFFSHRINDRQKFALSLLILALLISVVLLSLYANQDTREFVFPRGDSSRLVIWNTVLDRIQDRGWLIGLGILTPDSGVAGDLVFEHPQNMYLSVLFQGGLIGIALFAALVIAALRSFYEHYDMDDAKLGFAILTIALMSYLIDGHELVDKVGETWFLFWLPVGIALGLRWSHPPQTDP